MSDYQGRRVRLKRDRAVEGSIESVEHHPSDGRDGPHVSPSVRVLFDGEARSRVVASSELDWYSPAVGSAPAGWYA